MSLLTLKFTNYFDSFEKVKFIYFLNNGTILMCNNRTTESTIATVVTVAKPQPGDTCANYIKVDTKECIS